MRSGVSIGGGDGFLGIFGKNSQPKPTHFPAWDLAENETNGTNERKVIVHLTNIYQELVGGICKDACEGMVISSL